MEPCKQKKPKWYHTPHNSASGLRTLATKPRFKYVVGISLSTLVYISEIVIKINLQGRQARQNRRKTVIDTGVRKIIWFWPLTRCHFFVRGNKVNGNGTE